MKTVLDKYGVDYSTRSDKVLEIAIHKMALAYTNCPTEVKEKATTWLLNNGYSLDIK